MEPMRITLDGVRSATRMKDPTNSQKYSVMARVPVEELARYVSSGAPFANMRNGCSMDPTAQRSEKMIRDLKRQLENDPVSFCSRHSGVTMIADEAVPISCGNDGSVRIVFSDNTFLKEYKKDSKNIGQIRGLVNGGTTAGAIREAIDQKIYPNGKGLAFVNLEILCGPYDRKAVREIIKTRNSAKPIDCQSEVNFDGEFTEIREFLTSPRSTVNGRTFPPVRYRMGDPGAYEVAQLVQILTMFVRVDKRGDPSPSGSYRGIQGCLKYFRGPEGKSECLQMLPMLPKIVYLYEYIIANARAVYNKTGSFFGLSLFEGTDRPELRFPFSGLEYGVKVMNGWAYPILTAFAPDIAADRASWKFDPQDIFNRRGAEMISRLSDIFVSMDNKNVSDLGCNPLSYHRLRLVVEKEMERLECR